MEWGATETVTAAVWLAAWLLVIFVAMTDRPPESKN